MNAIKYNKSLVSLNIASNEISAQGFEYIFDAMSYNQSIISLNVSTIEGNNRNKITKHVAKHLKMMLVQN